MGTTVIVNGRTQTRPGVYAQIKSGVINPPVAESYGNILIVDTGATSAGVPTGEGWAIGSGINGTHKSGLDSVLEFGTLDEYRDKIRGGYLWLLGQPLFLPNGKGKSIPGASKVFYIKAATTVSASIAFALTGAVSTPLTFKPLGEGTGANGVVVSSNLTAGYGVKLVAGVVDNTKFKFKFYVASYKGLDTQNGSVPFDNISAAQSVPRLLCETPELLTVQEVLDWCNTSYEFLKYFAPVATPTIVGGGTITGTHVSAFPGYTLATGGTETYASTDMDAIVSILDEIDNAIFISTDTGANSMTLNNTKILDFCTNTSKYEKFLFLGGGGSTSVSQLKGLSGGNSQNIAAYFNSDNVIVCHGGKKKAFQGVVGLRTYNTLYFAFLAAGRVAGLQPQVPVTLKSVDIDGEVHRLNAEEQEFCIKNGILYSYYDMELKTIVIGQGVTTLLNNNYLVNNDASSFSIQLKRITAQLNKEIISEAKRVFYGSESGPNRNTVSPESVSTWLDGFLKSKIASTNKDELITDFGDIQVTVSQDNLSTQYSFVPNFENSKMVFTGFILDK